MHYGYIGLGNLGAACAGCLLRAGIKVTVYDLNADLAAPLVAGGATLAKSAEDAAASVVLGFVEHPPADPVIPISGVTVETPEPPAPVADPPAPVVPVTPADPAPTPVVPAEPAAPAVG